MRIFCKVLHIIQIHSTLANFLQSPLLQRSIKRLRMTSVNPVQNFYNEQHQGSQIVNGFSHQLSWVLLNRWLRSRQPQGGHCWCSMPIVSNRYGEDAGIVSYKVALASVAQLTGALSCILKGWRFDSQSGCIPRSRVWCLVGSRTGGNQSIISLFLSLFPFLSLPL